MTTVAEFEIKYHQYLDAEGRLREPALARDPAELVKMYRLMTLVRAFDTKAVNLQRTGKLGTYASCLGHEASHVGVGAAILSQDVLAPVYREFGTQLWRGVKLSEILTYWGGDERGCDFSVPRQDFPWCIPIASQMLHGAGVAMARGSGSLAAGATAAHLHVPEKNGRLGRAPGGGIEIRLRAPD